MAMGIRSLIGGGYDDPWFTNCPPVRYRVFVGARNTKKSTDIGGYEPIFKVLSNPLRNVLFIRLNDTDNSRSTYNRLFWCANAMGISDMFWFRKQPNLVIYRPTGQEFMFGGFNNPTGLKSITVPRGFLTDVYIEEAGEISSFEDFQMLDGSIRGLLPDGLFLQITFMLNPDDINSWIYKTFCEGAMPEDEAYMEKNDFQFFCDESFTKPGLFGKGLAIHRSSFRINEWRPPQYDEVAEMTKDTAFDIYKVHYLGMWGNSGGATYPEFSDKLVQDFLTLNQNRRAFVRDYAIGIDTGFSNGAGKVRTDGKIKSATVAQLAGLSLDMSKIYAIDEFFFTNEGKDEAHKKQETTLAEDIILWIIALKNKYASCDVLMKGVIKVFVDSADVGFPSVLRMCATKCGLTNVAFFLSTKYSIWARTEFERINMGWGDMLFSPNCANLIREIKSSQKPNGGNTRDDLNDHATNAWEYAWASFAPRIARWKQFDK